MHEHPFPPMDKAPRTNLQYINALYCIELLRNSNVDNVDLQTTWQYGQHFMTPWKDQKELVKRYLHTHHHDLRRFVMHKLMHVVNKLIEGMELFKTELYTMTPLEPNVYNSILANMDNMLHVTEFEKRMFDEYRMDMLKPNSTMRTVHSNFMDFEVADRILCGVFDTYTTLTRDKDTDTAKHHFGVHRHEILDNKVYLCIELLKKLYLRQIGELRIVDHPFAYSNFGAWACIFSMFYRLVIPATMHPNRLDRMYDKYLMRHYDAERAIQYARPFSTLSVEAVALNKLPNLNPEYIKDTVLEENYSVGSTYPDGLVEKYLVSQFLVERC